MPKTRRSLDDYEPEVDRFEEFLEVTEDKTLMDIETVDELIDNLENWFKEIEIPEIFWGKLAKSMLSWILEKRELAYELRKPVKVIRIKKAVRTIRAKEKWTKREIGLFAYRYQRSDKFSVEGISLQLGRSKKSLYNKAWRLGIKRGLVEE